MEYKRFKVGPLASNSYVVYSKETKAAVVIDIGGEPSEVIDFLNDNNLDLKYIILTHGHFDHILGAEKLKEWSGAKILAHSKAPDFLSDPEKNLSTVPYCQDISITADVLVNDGQVIRAEDIEMKFLHTPGHTPCSMVIVIDDIMFTGDTLFKGSMGRCDLVGGNLMAMYKSLHRLSKIAEDYIVLPGHQDSSTLSYEKEHNRYMRMGKENRGSDNGRI